MLIVVEIVMVVGMVIKIVLFIKRMEDMKCSEKKLIKTGTRWSSIQYF